MPHCVGGTFFGATTSQRAMRSAVQRSIDMPNYPTRHSGRRAVPNREAIYQGGIHWLVAAKRA